MADTHEVATLAGGCFWCLEAVYQDVQGVSKVVSGYMGGHVDNPTYRAVCTGNTGHAEVVQVTFDPSQVAYEDLLGIFFGIHDPTTLNRQGGDVGTQYRSAVFYHSDEQKEAAERMVTEAQQAWDNSIVTEVTPAVTFYEAEDYHQNYFLNNPGQPYCMAVVAPKVTKFRKYYSDKLRIAS
ncbi:MAG: peptide-methionine (S)-S-oxide reductase MsrA [Deinococcota bacterium]